MGEYDELHRDNGPVIDCTAESTAWYQNGYLHREDGPAVVYYNGDENWYLYGERHREDGPAIECVDGFKQWHFNGKYIKCSSQEEFLAIINPKLAMFW
jgi:hypothetical protein